MAYKSRKTARSGRCIVRSVDARALSRQSVVSCSVAQECVLVSVKATPTETTNDSQQTHTHTHTRWEAVEMKWGGVDQTEQVALIPPPYPFLMGANFSRSNSLFLRNPPRSVSPSTPPPVSPPFHSSQIIGGGVILTTPGALQKTDRRHSLFRLLARCLLCIEYVRTGRQWVCVV